MIFEKTTIVELEKLLRAHMKRPLWPGINSSDAKLRAADLSPETFQAGEHVTVQFDITNTGPVSRAEVAQLYVSDCGCTVPRPQKELKGFAKIQLEPGETKSVMIELDQEAFKFFHAVSG